MSLATELRPPTTNPPNLDTRKVLVPGGNRARVSETAAAVKTRKKQPGSGDGTAAADKRRVSKMPSAAVRENASVDSLCSTDSSSSSSSASSSSSSSSSLSAASAKTAGSARRRVRVAGRGVGSAANDALGGVEVAAEAGPVRRCDWITANSEPLYVSFHDKEWGVPVRDDTKLFELLVLSIALAEHAWLSILIKRELFRKLFDNFDPASVAKFSEEKLLSLSSSGTALLSEPKVRAVAENAKQYLRVQEEFGSFSNYCWRFVNNKPIRSGYRYARQVPVKTSKAEYISKDMMRRGFRCVGPTVVYSFMQVCGMVNDHLFCCFRYGECNENPKENKQLEDIDNNDNAKAMVAVAMERTKLVP